MFYGRHHDFADPYNVAYVVTLSDIQFHRQNLSFWFCFEFSPVLKKMTFFTKTTFFFKEQSIDLGSMTTGSKLKNIYDTCGIRTYDLDSSA